MNTLATLQVSENVIRKSLEMADKDPHGIIITVVSISVVFTALAVLYIAYSMIGKAVNTRFRRSRKKTTGPTPEEAAAIAMALDQETNGETYAAISLALHQYLNETVHDNESYIITIKRKR